MTTVNYYYLQIKNYILNYKKFLRPLKVELPSSDEIN